VSHPVLKYRPLEMAHSIYNLGSGYSGVVLPTRARKCLMTSMFHLSISATVGVTGSANGIT